MDNWKMVGSLGSVIRDCERTMSWSNRRLAQGFMIVGHSESEV
jgi:hypothetical protein